MRHVGLRGSLVLLSGASSTGKSATDHALLERATAPAVYWPQEAVVVRSTPDLIRDPEQVRALEIAAASAYFRSLAAYADSAFFVIGETCFWAEDQWAAWKASSSTLRALAVRLRADLGTLQQRERDRADRVPGTAERMSFDELRAPYDLEFDTRVSSPQEVAEDVIRAFNEPIPFHA